MKGDSDEALMLSYAKGNAKSFEALYGRYRQPLFGYFLRHVSDEATANDLYQGCWEKVIAARGRYRRRSPFRAWLFRIAHNHLVDHYRRGRDASPLPPELADPDADNPGEEIDNQVRRTRFLAALATLPEEQRDALLLRLEGDLGLDQIAAVTGVGAETAKSRLRYATKKLKEVLGV